MSVFSHSCASLLLQEDSSIITLLSEQVWIDVLINAGIDVELCHVEERGAIEVKKLKTKGRSRSSMSSKGEGKIKLEVKEESVGMDVESEDETMPLDGNAPRLSPNEPASAEPMQLDNPSTPALPEPVISSSRSATPKRISKPPPKPKRKSGSNLKHTVLNSDGEDITEIWYAERTRAMEMDARSGSTSHKRERSMSLASGVREVETAKRGRKSL